jgi:hypothetical protein
MPLRHDSYEHTTTGHTTTPYPSTNKVSEVLLQNRRLHADITARAANHRNPKIANTATNRNVTIRTSLGPRFNHTDCRQRDLARCVSCCRKSKMVLQSAAISRAVSFAHETIEP